MISALGVGRLSERDVQGAEPLLTPDCQVGDHGELLAALEGRSDGNALGYTL